MNRRILLTLICALPLQLFCQTYSFNRQTMLYFEDKHKCKVDTWQTPITVEVQQTFIVLSRKPTEAGERTRVDTLQIQGSDRERRGKNDIYTRYKIKDGRILIIYADQYITMVTKESPDHKHVEYVFYNQKPE